MSQFHSVTSSIYDPFFPKISRHDVRLWSFPLAVRLLILCAIFFLASCEDKRSDIIDSVGTPPILAQVMLQPMQVNSDTINVSTTRLPEDLLTISTTIVCHLQIGSPSPATMDYSITSPDSQVIVDNGHLLDDGKSPDQMTGDGIYSAKAAFQIRRVQIGTYNVEVFAKSADGYQSNALLMPLTIFRGDHPPVLFDLVAPDTIKLGSQSQVLLLSIRASDPDGFGDVAKVVFNSFRPDSSASGGNPFLMFDDGLSAHGDDKANDGVYSLLVSLPSNTQTGTYRFEFQAFDRSNQPSNVIALLLTVKP